MNTAKHTSLSYQLCSVGDAQISSVNTLIAQLCFYSQQKLNTSTAITVKWICLNTVICCSQHKTCKALNDRYAVSHMYQWLSWKNTLSFVTRVKPKIWFK